jgi:glycosyltransferase involved in cell wall biosynthesis
VGHRYPPRHTGGYELTCASAVAHLRRHGHHVRVLTGRDPLAPDDAPQDVHRELARFPSRPRATSPWAALRGERANAATLTRHLAAFRPDVVSWWRLGELSVSLVERVHRAGLPAVGVLADPWPLEAPARDPWARLTRRGPALPADATWLVVSEHLRRRLLDAGLRLPRAPIVHPGVDLARFRPRLAAPTWRWRLLCAGRLSPLKGADTAVAALPGLPGASLRLVGPGSAAQRAALRALAVRLGVGARVDLAGPRPGDAMPAELRGADALLFSVRWPEPWGLVPLEAMACGVPVVATGSGGSAEYLRDGENALLVAPDDPGALAAAVRRLAEDPALRAHVVARGRQTAERFPAEAANDAIRRALESAARGPGPGAPRA